MKESTVRVTFKANDAGKIESMLLNIDGRIETATRNQE